MKPRRKRVKGPRMDEVTRQLVNAWIETAATYHGNVGVFAPLPPELAAQFPERDEHDSSPPHVTCLYVGRVPDYQATLVRRVLQEAVGWWNKDLHFKLAPSVSYFPPSEHSGNCQVAKLDVVCPGLHVLREQLKEALVRSGVNVADNWPVFRPHATLQYLEPGVSKYTGQVPKGQWVANRLELWGFGTPATLVFGQ